MKINQAFEILRNAGGVRAARIITENKKNLSGFNVRRMARQLRRGTPVAKIIHQKWFYGLPFYTNRWTLDPRPDTETLVAAVIADCGAGRAPAILDLGTGTGCIIVSCVKNIADSRGIAIDKSLRACMVARRNVRKNEMAGRIRILRRSFDTRRTWSEKFDIIVSNPPYIARGDARVDAGARHDPDMALYAANNGMAAYQAIAQNAREWIKPGGKIYLEIGDGMDAAVRIAFEERGWTFVRGENDLADILRVLVFQYVGQ